MWPFLFIIVYAGMQALPRDCIEAVRVDGATTWQTVRHVILPLLRNTIAIAIVLTMIEGLKVFTEVYVMTGGGPGDSTSILSMYIVKQAFDFSRLGYAAAVSALLLGVGLLLVGNVLLGTHETGIGTDDVVQSDNLAFVGRQLPGYVGDAAGHGNVLRVAVVPLNRIEGNDQVDSLRQDELRHKPIGNLL